VIVQGFTANAKTVEQFQKKFAYGQLMLVSICSGQLHSLRFDPSHSALADVDCGGDFIVLHAILGHGNNEPLLGWMYVSKCVPCHGKSRVESIVGGLSRLSVVTVALPEKAGGAVL
jgi:hypothetical protein